MDRRFDTEGPAWGAADLELHTPTRAAGFVSDLVVPLGQAVVSGLVISGVISFLWSRTGEAGDIGSLFWGLALVIGGVAWVLLLIDSRKLLRVLEKLSGLDLDGDGSAGEPAHGPRVLEVHIKQGGKTRIVDSEGLGIDDDRLIAFSVGMNNGRGLAESTWSKTAVFPRGINEYRAFRSKLLEAGLIDYINAEAPAQGFEKTASGRAFFRRVAGLAQIEAE